MINIETFEPICINGIKTIYYISESGVVISYKHDKIKTLKIFETKIKNKKCKKKPGYLYVKLWIDGKSKAAFIHRLVAQAFIPNPKNKPEVNHIDGNKHNNYVTNLEWVTSKENKNHAKRNNLSNYASCEDSGRAKYKNNEIEYACKLLSENEYPISEISKISKIDMNTLYGIRSKNIYNKISSKYVFPEYTVESNSKYTDEDIIKVCKLREQGYTVSEIVKITGVKKSTVNDVIHRRRRKRISVNYNF